MLHPTQGTRPDIAFTVNDLSRFNSRHSVEHWQAIKRVMRYLKGTIDLKLQFRVGKFNGLHAFTDADWASEVDERRSCSGYVTIMANAAISWYSHRQDIVALSSTEAEYIALSELNREILWLRAALKEIDKVNEPTQVYCDNSSTMKLSHNDCYRKRTKHIDVRFHHTRQMIEKRSLQ